VDTLQREHEPDVIERVAQYREDYRAIRLAALQAERERRSANDEVYFDGHWLAARDAEQVARALQRREFLTFFEIALLLTLTVAAAFGLCWLFAFLFLPE
jgi:hypothetical protein